MNFQGGMTMNIQIESVRAKYSCPQDYISALNQDKNQLKEAINLIYQQY